MKDGGSAFPSHGSMGEVSQEGMSLRDYFAAKAMAAMWANPLWVEECAKQTNGGPIAIEQVFANRAYTSADAMIAEREKNRE